mgnify:CR=1 FL=1
MFIHNDSRAAGAASPVTARRAQAMCLPTFDKPRIVACAEDHPEHLALPKGCLDVVRSLLKSLGVPSKEIGRIGGGRKKPTGGLDVALIQSLVRKGVVNDLVGAYGHLVVDECHHLPAFSFEQVARRARARYVLGLSATVPRKDGHHPIIAAGVQRLIRDGVDPPLGNLFVHAARSFPVTAEGSARARSSSEAFLYRRLETLSATTGRFRINETLPIRFGPRSRMDVDFLCPEARLVVEIDGAQHLSDAEAYRRDRHKDALLQEHGYFVLRFLAEDIGRNLNAVLDAILRALAHCTR